MKRLATIGAAAMAWLVQLSVAWANPHPPIPFKPAPPNHQFDSPVPEINVSTLVEAVAVLVIVALILREMFARQRRV